MFAAVISGEALLRKPFGREYAEFEVRSGGTSKSARHRVTNADLRWADVILVMEKKHRSQLLAEFGRLIEGTPLHVLDIPDEYDFMDPELIEHLRHSVGAVLGMHC